MRDWARTIEPAPPGLKLYAIGVGSQFEFLLHKRTLCHRRKFLNRAGKPSFQPTSPAYGMELWIRGSAPEMDY